PTSAVGSAAAATRPAGSATTGTTAAGTTTTGTTAASSAVTGTRAAGAASGTSVTGTTIPVGSATTGTRAASSAVSGPTTSLAGKVLAIDANESSFKPLGSAAAGITTVILRNLGKEHHDAQFIRLNPGVTLDQVIAALQQQEPPDIFPFEGGPAEVVPGR